MLRGCVLEKRPVYEEVDASRLLSPLEIIPPGNPLEMEERLVGEVLGKIKEARHPLIVGDGLAYRWDIRDEINAMAKLTGFPTVSFAYGKGLVDESLPNWCGRHGTSYGDFDHEKATREADLVLLFCPLLSDTNTFGWSRVPNSEVMVAFHGQEIEFKENIYPLRSKPFLRKLIERLTSEKPTISNTSIPQRTTVSKAYSIVSIPRSSTIKQDILWPLMSPFLQQGDNIVLADGTPIIGVRDLIIPKMSASTPPASGSQLGTFSPQLKALLSHSAKMTSP